MAFLIFAALPSVFAQGATSGVVLTNNSSPLNNPLLWLQEMSGNSATVPLFEVSGFSNSSTLGIEVTSTATPPTGSATNPVPNWSILQPAGYGGLTLFQTTGATSTANIASPVLAMCGAQWGDYTPSGTPPPPSAGPACWYWQVAGGGGGLDAPDTLQLKRLITTNATTNITVLFPAAINLATAPYVDPVTGLQTKAGQITVGPQPVGLQNANTPSTFTGATTMSTTSSSATMAGPVTVQTGQVIKQGPNSSSIQGALQILQSYYSLGGGSATNPYVGQLACPDTTTANRQSVTPCGTVGQAENWVGVYNAIPGQGAYNMANTTVTILRYGRVPVANAGASMPSWNNGDYICKDDTPANASFSIDNGSTPCPAGESIGIAVGDASGTNPHLVDLVQSPSTGGGAMLTFFCTGPTAGSGTTLGMFPSSTGTACNNTYTPTGTGANGSMVPVSVAGWLKNLQVYYTAAPTLSGSDTITVYDCTGFVIATCVSTGITCPVTFGTNNCPDITHTYHVSVGDGIQIRDAVGSGTVGKDVRASIEIQ